MEKRYLSPFELLTVAIQHAFAADHLLQESISAMNQKDDDFDSLAPITSLMYLAFQLTLKAYCLHDHRPVKEYKNLMELIELNLHLGLSHQEIGLLKTLSRHQVFNKGLAFDLWENRQQLQVFCAQILQLYERLQAMMPLELQSDYQ
jgi:hypothetical protein